MITAIELENFKGIATRQRIDFAPLTLLFGANSAGKSTILQALLYLHELIEHGSADIDRTELGGAVLELGGFARLVHRHDMNRAIVLRVEFDTLGSLERFGRDLADFPFPDLDDGIITAWLELTIRFRMTPTFRGPLVERAVIGVNGDTEPLVWLEVGASLRDGEPLQARINLGHHVLADAVNDPQRTLFPGVLYTDITEAWEQIAVPEDVLIRNNENVEHGGSKDEESELSDVSVFNDGRSLPMFALARTRNSVIPPIDEPIRVVPFSDIEGDRKEIDSLSILPPSEETKAKIKRLKESIESRDHAAAQVRTFFEMVVLGTTSQLLETLQHSLYVGPLRAVPPRGFLYEKVGSVTSWADGLAAWDLLLADRRSLVDETNRWLRRLDAGCQLVVQQLYDSSASAEELAEGRVDITVRRLLLDIGTGTLVLPSELGAGVSQMIPVIVAALEGRSNMVLIEQPEVHVHPALQVGLGDLLIGSATRDSKRRNILIETHSEHLILRLLRRIRETTENELGEGAPAFSADDLSVVYVENTPNGVRIRRLRVDELGEFKDRWPKGFFAERMKELV